MTLSLVASVSVSAQNSKNSKTVVATPAKVAVAPEKKAPEVITDEVKVRKILVKSGKPLRIKDIAELTGIDSKAVDKAIKKLMKDGDIVMPMRDFYEAR